MSTSQSPNAIRENTAALRELLTDFRRELHQHPELSGQEHRTAERIKGALESLEGDFQIVPVAGTGVCMSVESGQPGPTVMVRVDTDALPIEEANEFEYKSAVPGVSHKCGHDGHTAIGLGLCNLLSTHPPSSGKVIVLFQPSEENGKGAAAVLEDVWFKSQSIDYIFALHNLPGYPLKEIVVKPGTFTSNVQSIAIRLTGATSHAAEPENGKNPAFAIAEIIQFAEKAASPGAERDDFMLITPIHIRMGEIAYGTSAGEGEIHLTLRSWKPERMDESSRELESLLDRLSGKYGLEIAYDWLEKFRSNENNEEAVEMIRQAASDLGLRLHEREHPFKWGEDFGLFTQRFKGTMFGIGAGEETPALHHAAYDYPDEITVTGVRVFYRIIVNLLGDA